MHITGMNKIIQMFVFGSSFGLLGFADIPKPPPPPGIWICDFDSDRDFVEGKKVAQDLVKKGELAIVLSGIFSDDAWLTKSKRPASH